LRILAESEVKGEKIFLMEHGLFYQIWRENEKIMKQLIQFIA